MQNSPTGVPVCVALHRSQAKLIGYTGCPPRPTLSGVISLYFMAVDLRPSSLSPSVALTQHAAAYLFQADYSINHTGNNIWHC